VTLHAALVNAAPLQWINPASATSHRWAFPVKLNTEDPNFQLVHIISWNHARYAAT
jgi:hypothetical protein